VFNFNKQSQIDALDEAIDDLLRDLKGGGGNTHEQESHTVATENLIKLMKLKMELKPSWRPSPDVLVTAIGSVASVVLMLHFEKLGVITSKAISFVMKAK